MTFEPLYAPTYVEELVSSMHKTNTFLLLIDVLQVDCLVHNYVDDTTLSYYRAGTNPPTCKISFSSY